MYYGFLLLLRTAAHLSVGSESYKNVQVIYSTHHILSTSCTMINTFPPLCSGGNFADAVFRFNANISYSGVLHAVTQDVSCPRLLLMVFFSSHLLWPRLITVIQCHHHQLPCACSLHRVCSQRTKRSWSTTPSWPFYLRRLSCLRWTLSWRAISRPFAVWWPPRLVSRPSPSCLSKDAGHVLLHLLTC